MTAGRIASVEEHEAVSGGHLARLLVLRTDAGERGVGEIASQPGRSLTELSISALNRLLVGRDVFDVTALAAEASASAESTASDPIIVAAVTSALLDIVGQRLGVPLCQLLGGPMHNAIPVCAIDWAPFVVGVDELAEAARRTVAAGFTALRVDLPEVSGPAAQVELVTAVKNAVPDDIRIVVRGSAQPEVSRTLDLVNGLHALDVLWFEHPTVDLTTASLRRLYERSPIALAAGRWLRPELVDALASGGLVDHLILEPGMVGGLRAARHFAALAEIHHIDVVAVGSGGVASLAVAAQLAEAIPNLAMLELKPGQLPVVNGEVPVDSRPGISRSDDSTAGGVAA